MIYYNEIVMRCGQKVANLVILLNIVRGVRMCSFNNDNIRLGLNKFHNCLTRFVVIIEYGY